MFCKTNIDSVGVGLVANKNAYSNSERVYSQNEDQWDNEVWFWSIQSKL